MLHGAIVLCNTLPETTGCGYALSRRRRVVKQGALEVALGQTLTSSAQHGKSTVGGF
jgi:hypothetical protein